MIFIWLFAFGVISILGLLLGPASNIEALSIISSQFTWHFYYNMQYNEVNLPCSLLSSWRSRYLRAISEAEHRYLTSLYLTFTIYYDYRMSIILNCICYLPRDSLVVFIILGYFSPNIDTIFWVYYIYSLNWLQVISRHF